METLGYQYTDSISSKLAFIFIGEKPSSKYQKAQQLGILCYEERESIQKTFHFPLTEAITTESLSQQESLF